MPNPSSLTHLECSSTGVRRDADVLSTVDLESGRPLLARYDLEKAKQTFSLKSIAGRTGSLWRYEEVLPVRDPQYRITLGEGWTPLLATPRLGAELSLKRLYVKDEGGNPTGSFKARGLAMAVSKAVELGAGDLAVPTAGNAGAALAAYAARAGRTAHVAMPADAPLSIQTEVKALDASLHLVDGLIHDAGHLIAEGCQQNGWFNLATLKEPYRLEGKKTMGYELWEQFGGELPEVVLYPTGGGTGLIGMWKAFDELQEMGFIDSRRPRLVSVQSVGCAPVVKAFEAGLLKAEPWQDAATLAPGIRVPHVFADDLILRAIAETEGKAIAVEDEQIVSAMRRIASSEGIDAGPEGAATYAGLEQLVAAGEVAADERIVLFNCGSGLKHPELRPEV